uniref:Secreted protein n=1 Tax=Ascaris lumbricoides TaxID=6252 RepID=A0A0M3I7C2_ASCLU
MNVRLVSRIVIHMLIASMSPMDTHVSVRTVLKTFRMTQSTNQEEYVHNVSVKQTFLCSKVSNEVVVGWGGGTVCSYKAEV